MRRLILIPLLIVVAVLAIGGGIAYIIYDNYTYYRTDDAQVTGPIVNVSAPAAGQLTTLSVKQGDTVTAGQTLATIAPVAGANANNTLSISSPISGIVLQTPVVQGQFVAPGLSIIQVTDLKAVNVTAYVDEGAINNVKIGQDVDIHIDAYSDTNFTGKVQQIVKATAGQFSLLPTQDNASGNFTKVGQRIPVVISLDGTGGKDVTPGMSVEVTIHIH
ncbi:MAG: efflux RND transporter periplasmic adaptor subunit [Ktedonobacteraceae bacterium]|nr:efflux RND transporter periplasmic adaptor subunit [Ktedonobacteraceae bacterium]